MVETSGGTGLKIKNGNLSYGQFHLTVHNNSKSPNAIGIDLQSVVSNLVADNRPIWQNQFSTFNGSRPNDSVNERGFMLVTSNIDSSKRVFNPSIFLEDIATRTL
jgi:hypothetical protein